MSLKQNLSVSVFLHKCLMMLDDLEYTTFKMFGTQMSNYLFVISFQLMFYKTLRYRLPRALCWDLPCWPITWQLDVVEISQNQEFLFEKSDC